MPISKRTEEQFDAILQRLTILEGNRDKPNEAEATGGLKSSALRTEEQFDAILQRLTILEGNRDKPDEAEATYGYRPG